jgi:formate hydrogenlyase subunit 4
MLATAENLLHVLFVLAFPPLLPGVIAKTKAWFAGRVGPPILQPYYDLARLFQKGSVFSTTATWIFRAGPVAALATAALAACIVPLANSRPDAASGTLLGSAPLSFTGDMILLAYLLGLGRFFTASAALDTGSSFEGMGAAREVTFACLAEPALFLGFIVLAKLSGSLRLDEMLGGSLWTRWASDGAPLALVFLSWFIVLLAENSRIPFDDPNTHLELTMVHEVMVLDHSGPALGMVFYGAALKLFLFAALVVRLVLPPAVPWIAWPALAAGLLLVAVLIGIVESTMARLRLTQVPLLLVAACLLSAFGVVLLMR